VLHLKIFFFQQLEISVFVPVPEKAEKQKSRKAEKQKSRKKRKV